MIDDVQKRLLEITNANGYPIAVRAVHVLEDDSELDELQGTNRTVFLIPGSQGRLTIRIVASPGGGASETALRSTIVRLLEPDYDIEQGPPLVVVSAEPPPEADEVTNALT